ncbi:gliding motility-associated protein GldE [Dokdonia donghaensis]|uniref:Hemolysin n=1 Tax=Dokdonia donghaensis DSW-1 TaxID=1300343 RepID=A0A0A2GX27_9FLAO|nr:gliding motility-associated protein GldE [Dokdonia donghaensis]ANH59766.1 Magnesium and cobalt efflux protein CorC [Dokdonia donghaensis DSW-1]KGO07108.1 hemolysin [Dokdonia donghaensis DSW-1]
MDPDPEPLLILLLALDTSSILSLVALVILLTCSALISGAEVAFFSLSPSDLLETEELVADRKMMVVKKLLTKPKKLLATILVANNAINIAIVLLFASLGEVIFANITAEILTIPVRFLLEVVLITFLILLFGEILPKVYANRNNKKFAALMAYPLRFLDMLFTPLSSPMRLATLWIQNKLGEQKSSFNVDQLSQALELTSEEDTTTEEQKILKGIVSFGNTDTKQVMRPRMDVFALNKDDDYQKVLKEITENGFSRIPVFSESVDTIVGILYVKDLLPHLTKKDFDWTKLIREPYFVPENKKLDDLLAEFKEKKNHLAIVVDEYGGTSGLISLEDIIEEIVGDISDEFDDENIIYSKLDDYNWIFDGKTSLKDFYRIIKLEDTTIFENKKGEAETIAGFVLEVSGAFPRKNEVIKYDTYAFTVEALDKKRIKQIKFTITS